MKLRISDWSLLFSIYLGSSKGDGACAVALDSSKQSDRFRSDRVSRPGDQSAAFQPHLRGSVGAFVTKLSGDGSRILWSYYYVMEAPRQIPISSWPRSRRRVRTSSPATVAAHSTPSSLVWTRRCIAVVVRLASDTSPGCNTNVKKC